MQQQLTQVFANVQAAMLANGWALTRTEDNAEDGYMSYVREYSGAATLHTDGTGIWGAAAGMEVHVGCITFVADEYDEEDDYSWHVGVVHTHNEAGYMLYTDNALQQQMSALCGVELRFTEQGMQDAYYMSME